MSPIIFLAFISCRSCFLRVVLVEAETRIRGTTNADLSYSGNADFFFLCLDRGIANTSSPQQKPKCRL
jgi:hypothetical protein